MDDLVERVARIIANAMGDNFADAFKNKTRWIAKRGESGGRFRDVNEPMQCDYLAAAEAAIEATGITRLTAERDAALAHAERLAGALTGAEAALAAGVAAVDAYNAENITHLCGGALFGMAKALGTARAALASWQERAA